MPKARLLKDYHDGKLRHPKGAVVTVSEGKLEYDEKRTKANPGRKPLFERIVEDKPAEAKPAPAPAKKPAQAPLA